MYCIQIRFENIEGIWIRKGCHGGHNTKRRGFSNKHNRIIDRIRTHHKFVRYYLHSRPQ